VVQCYSGGSGAAVSAAGAQVVCLGRADVVQVYCSSSTCSRHSSGGGRASIARQKQSQLCWGLADSSVLVVAAPDSQRMHQGTLQCSAQPATRAMAERGSAKAWPVLA
jgi:hypothetical protein